MSEAGQTIKEEEEKEERGTRNEEREADVRIGSLEIHETNIETLSQIQFTSDRIRSDRIVSNRIE